MLPASAPLDGEPTASSMANENSLEARTSARHLICDGVSARSCRYLALRAAVVFHDNLFAQCTG